MMLRVLLAVSAVAVFALGASACGKGESNEGKLMPKLAPPPRASVPANLRITVAVDGVEGAAIVAQTLESTPPDFADDERRAWRLATLLPAATPTAATTSAVFAVTGDRGVTVELRVPTDAKGPVPALLMSRRGDIVATLVDPSAPFPSFHGQGGRLGRPGDPLPRIANVSRIELAHK